MADLSFATGDALTRKAWAKKYWMEAKTSSFFYENGLVGSDENNDIIVEFGDLMKDQGDVIYFGQTRELSGSGVTADSTMEGNEEAPNIYDDALTLNQKRNAVRLNGALSNQRSADNSLRAQAKELLKRWMAETIDQDLFDAIGTSPTKIYYGGDATSTATIESGDYMTLQLVAKTATYARKATPKIMGKMINGMRTHVCVMAPDQHFDLTQRDAGWAQAQREAQRRGDDNPIFKRALGMYQNVAMHEHSRAATVTNWGSGSDQPGATALFMGVGAGAIAYSNKRVWNEKTFDYANKVGFCVGAIYATTKAVFNSADNAVVAVRTYRTNN